MSSEPLTHNSDTYMAGTCCPWVLGLATRANHALAFYAHMHHPMSPLRWSSITDKFQ